MALFLVYAIKKYNKNLLSNKVYKQTQEIIMKELSKLTQAVRLALIAGAISVPAIASAADTKAVEVTRVNLVQQEESDGLEEESLEEEVEKITITGSRIRRSEFSSASPVQIINGDVSRELGFFNATDMLQSTSQAAGSQIDNSFGGFVLDNGPGATTVGFRGLGANRTLVLLNGKRMVAAGVGGAPVAADLSLVPSVMIERVENLFDGASTVYGSDAIAGVSNIIFKKDVEGFEFETGYSKPSGSGAEEATISGMYGKTFDNGYFSIGAEYYNQEAQSMGENPFTSGCDEFIYETRDGTRLNENRSTGPLAEGFGNCDIFPLTNRVYFADTLWGSLYRTPGSSNTGIPNYSETTVPAGWVDFHDDWYAGDSNGDGIDDIGFVDGDGDGFRDVSFRDPFYAYSLSDYAKSGDLTNKTERASIILNGDYNFQDENDTVFYYEGLYAQRNSDSFGTGYQLFPTISAENPFNPCGVNAGTLCGGGLVDWGPSSAQPIVNIRGDRDRAEVEVSQYRAVAGITGNISALDDIGGGNWYYDAYATYAKSSGKNVRQGVHSERLSHSLTTTVLNDDGSITCGNGSDGCVPVNFFADNIYQLGGGTFTPAEAEYLFVDRVTNTYIEQAVLNAYVGGDFYTLPWNEEVVAGIIGAEFRKDKISTDANDVATQGLLQSWFVDKGAEGNRDIKEVFAEVDLPLVRGQEFAEELTFTVAGRLTKETFFDTHSTYSLKGIYRPVEWFTLRGTKGTSFRAPDLRERFILGTSGFNTVSDPCVVPELARTSIDENDINSGEVYDPSGDEREQYTLDSCTANGVDPLALGIGEGDADFLPNYSVEIETSGSEELDPETSLSKTFGIVVEQPFSEDFELTFSVTRFDIEITNSIAKPTYGYVINQCYNNREQPDGQSGFCDKVTRDSDGSIDLITPGFINVGFESSKGFDYNIYYQQDFLLGDENLAVALDVSATKMTEQSFDILGDIDDNVGEVTTPEWRGNARLSFEYSDFTFNWYTQFIGGGEFDDEFKSEYSSDYDACSGLMENGEAVECRPVEYTENYFNHRASLNWKVDNYSVTVGVNNVFDREPELVDANDGPFNFRNIPLGVGYDFQGRTVYMNFAMKL